MKVYLIDPRSRTIEAVEVDDGLAGIRRLIGFDSVDTDEIDDGGDRLFFDESCFIRQQDGAGRFRLDNLAPVAGRAVVAGGSLEAPRSATLDLAALRARVRFL
jgi:hypothetical protein